MRTLHLMHSVDPAYGGPIEALIRSDAAWRRLGHSREIASLDTPGDRWVAECPIPVHPLGSEVTRRWAKRFPLLRYGFTPHLVPWLRRHAAGYDAMVVHGLWNYTDLAARRVLPALGIPYFVYTHGMLDPWFRVAHPTKYWAKQVVWWCAEEPLLRHARAVLFTCEGERRAAHRAFWPWRFPAEVVSYGTGDPPSPTAAQDAAFRAALPDLKSPYLLFLGRLHEKKGCDLLVCAFARVAATHPDLDLVLAGPDPCGLRSRLEALARRLGIAHRVHWPGLLRDGAKWGALYGCRAFVLPSHGENFGVAVAEAMACAKPVLVSDRVNIAPEIRQAGAGLVAPDTVEGTEWLLRGFLAFSHDAAAAMGRRARLCFERRFDIDRVIGRTAELMMQALRP